jgi:hypothetical protein
MNILNLGFFAAIQTLQHQKSPRNINELIAAVEESFMEFCANKLNNNFLSLTACMVETMKMLGSNNYKVPHMGKEKMRKRGILPTQIECDKLLYTTV